jgi:hypothetical protein
MSRPLHSVDEVPNSGHRYQWLNHYALFSGGYREDAMECMEKLVQKYGKEEDEEDDDSDLS